jgi:exodeoxyribonuclease VII small subunit
MEKTFEASLAELEKIVEQLENGDIPLEESLKLFEVGVKLSRECRDRLTEAERRIEVLMKDGNGNLSLSELPSGQSSSGESQPAGGKRYVFGDD